MSRRMILAFFTIWVISILSFVIIQLPEGDAADRFLDRLMQTNSVSGDQRIAEELRQYLGLDKPMYYRYWMWVWNLAHGDLGRSIAVWSDQINSQKPVKKIIGDRLWLTIVLTGFTIIVTWTFAIPVGIYSAVRQHSVGDYVFTLAGFTGIAVPDFLLGLVLMYIAFRLLRPERRRALLRRLQERAVELRQGHRPAEPPLDPGGRPGNVRHCGADQGHAQQPARRARQAIRRHGPRQGGEPGQAHHEIPGQGRHQPTRQHRGLPAALPWWAAASSSRSF